MRFRPRLPASAVAVIAVVGSLAAPASANDFASDGSFLFESDAVHTDGFEQVSPPQNGLCELRQIEDALEGKNVLACTTQYQTADLSFDLPNAPAVYEATLWLRGEGLAGIHIGYRNLSASDFTQLYPTGRMTSDGWMELRSAPFSVDGLQGASPLLFFYGSVEVDAFEIHPSNAMPFAAPQRCDGLSDALCAGERTCLGGWCRNPSGWVPPIPNDRALLAKYLENRLRFFFGPYLNREHYLAASLAETEAMADAPTPWRFWNGFATAIRRLRDSHTSAFSLSSYLIDNRRPLNSCFTLGDADLTHTLAPSHDSLPDVLVSHVGSSHNWSFGAGDRLVAVDGEHPLAWMQSLIAHDWDFSAANDPSSLAMHAERLRSAIPRYASTITVIHCEGTTCSPPQIVDVLALPEVEPDTPIDVVSCDHRPQPLVANQPTNHYMGASASSGPVLGTEADEKIFGLVWDLLIPQSSADSTIQSAVTQWRNQARGVVIDHRAGNGGAGAQGGTSIADPILAFVHPPTLFGIGLFRQSIDESGPKTIAEGLDLVAAYADSSLAWRGGGPQPRTDVPVALLITRDVSFSDLFPYAFSTAERVRIFGPNPTNGAFSSFFGMSYWYGFNYQLASGDTIGADGRSLCGRGTNPDDIVLPRQSDLIAGVDTVAAQALAWIRTEIAP